MSQIITLFLVNLALHYVIKSMMTTKEQQKETKTLNRILASVSHEQRAQISGVEYFSEKIMTNVRITMDGAKILKYASKIISLSFFQKYLLCDFLDFNRMKNKSLKLVITEFCIETEVSEVIVLCGFIAKKKKIKLNMVSNLVETEKKIFNDRNRIKQILINFLGNAIKF